MVGALGPRVGGAHVNVGLLFDDKSIDNVGRRITAQLSRVGAQNGKTFRQIGQSAVTAWRGMLGAMVSSTPILGPAISGLTGGLTLLAGAMQSVVTASYSLGPVLTSLGLAATTMGIGFNLVGQAISEFDPKRLKVMLAAMSPPAREFTLTIRALKKELQDKVSDHIFAGLLGEIKQLNSGFIPLITKGFLGMADAMNALFKETLQYINSADGLAVIGEFFNGQVDIFKRLSKAVVPFLDGFLRLMNALTPSSQRLADRITDVGTRFQSWTKGVGFAERIDTMMKRAEKTSGLLFKVIGNLGSAFSNIFGITNPASNSFLQILVDITQQFEDFTKSTKGEKSIQSWAQGSIDVLVSMGHVIREVFKFMAALSDSRVLVSFLETVADAFTILGKLPLEKFASKFADFMEAMDPIAGPILAAIIAFTTFNILLGNMIGQIGGFVLAITRGGSGLAKFGKQAGEFTKFLFAFKSVGVVLRTAFKFAGIAGLAIWVGTIIAQSKELRGKVVKVFSALGDVFKELVSAASEIFTALQPVFTALDKLTPVVEFIAGLLLDGLVFAFKALAVQIRVTAAILTTSINVILSVFNALIAAGTFLWNAFSAIFSGISTVLGVFVSAFKLQFQAMWLVVTTVFNAIKAVVTVVWQAILLQITIVVTAILAVITSVFNVIQGVVSTVWGVIGGTVTGVMNSIFGVVKTVWNAIYQTISTVFSKVKTVVSGVVSNVYSTVSSGFTKVRDFIAGIPGKILSLGSTFTKAGVDLGKRVIDGMWEGLKKVGAGAANFASSIKNAINNALHLPFTIKGPGPLPDFTINKFARGTNFAPGGPALVGEQGPELLYLSRGSMVKTASQTRSILGADVNGSGGGDMNVFNITLSMDDLSQLRDLDAFLRMMDRARVTQRKSLRSGTVNA